MRVGYQEIHRALRANLGPGRPLLTKDQTGCRVRVGFSNADFDFRTQKGLGGLPSTWPRPAACH